MSEVQKHQSPKGVVERRLREGHFQIVERKSNHPIEPISMPGSLTKAIQEQKKAAEPGVIGNVTTEVITYESG